SDFPTCEVRQRYVEISSCQRISARRRIPADESAGSPVFLFLQAELNSAWTRFCFAKRLNAAGRRRASARGWPPFRFPDL
ncbi:hypothetical protein, partial [Flavonifractor plautii]|uniref:hypothetical protein n=1 Tax=Flavonifractor plautii TaxID=292800 RepID=UPI003D7E80DA